MTDQNSQNQGNQVPTTPEGQTGTGASPSGTPLTEERLNEILTARDQKFEERMNNTYRGMQGLSRQVQGKLTALDQTIQQMQAAGQQIDPAVVQKMKTDIMAGAFTEAEPPQPEDQGGQPATSGTEDTTDDELDNDPFFNRIMGYQEAMGVELLDEDPEIQALPDINEVGEEGFFEAFRQQIAAKQQRLAVQGPATAIARSPILGTSGTPASNPIEGITDQTELWNMAATKFDKRTR